MMLGDVGIFDADDIIGIATHSDDRLLELDGRGALDG